MAGDLRSACRRGQETRAEREILAAGFKQIEEVKFLKENYFVRLQKVEAAKDQGPSVKSSRTKESQFQSLATDIEVR